MNLLQLRSLICHTQKKIVCRVQKHFLSVNLGNLICKLRHDFADTLQLLSAYIRIQSSINRQNLRRILGPHTDRDLRLKNFPTFYETY